jgi:lipid II:glycine glycyltransferase (peptidoglycan interpeptide bridge formation enzyme)
MRDLSSVAPAAWAEASTGIESEWDSFVTATEGGHHAQTSRWGVVQSRRGWDVTTVVSRDGGRLSGGVQILTRPVRGVGRVAYIDRGPLLVDGSLQSLRSAAEMLQDFTRRVGVTLMVVQPPDGAHDLHRVMRSAGFGASHMKTSLPATTRLALSLGADELMARMKSKTRYNIRLGQRSGIAVRVGERADVGVFHDMLVRTADRQGFVSNSLSYLEDLFDTLGPECRIFIAEYDGRPVAGMLAMTFGDTVLYKRGAWSGEEGKRRPNEVMHWEAIRWAISNGYAFYDFDGIEPHVARAVLDGEKIPGEAVESVTRFKLGFGGDVLLLPETSTYLPNRVLRYAHDRVYSRVADVGFVKGLVKKARVG